jgi:DNA transposition AAA+ family ATPase
MPSEKIPTKRMTFAARMSFEPIGQPRTPEMRQPELLQASSAEFIITKQHKRFVEFCDACRRYRYVGLGYGPPGVGKTLSARQYAQWDQIEPLLDWRLPVETALPRDSSAGYTALYTPTVANTPNQIAREVDYLRLRLSRLVENTIHSQSEGIEQSEESEPYTPWHPSDRTELIVVDEADRLKTTGLEQMRDIYDRGKLGLILIGMPGIEKRLARYPQLYSRVGFVHQFRPLSADEVRFILEQKWDKLGLKLRPDDFTDAEAVSAIIRITAGNFRLIHRLLAQIERVLEINELHVVTKEVVETARENLVIGMT